MVSFKLFYRQFLLNLLQSVAYLFLLYHKKWTTQEKTKKFRQFNLIIELF